MVIIIRYLLWLYFYGTIKFIIMVIFIDIDYYLSCIWKWCGKILIESLNIK